MIACPAELAYTIQRIEAEMKSLNVEFLHCHLEGNDDRADYILSIYTQYCAVLDDFFTAARAVLDVPWRTEFLKNNGGFV